MNEGSQSLPSWRQEEKTLPCYWLEVRHIHIRRVASSPVRQRQPLSLPTAHADSIDENGSKVCSTNIFFFFAVDRCSIAVGWECPPGYLPGIHAWIFELAITSCVKEAPTMKLPSKFRRSSGITRLVSPTWQRWCRAASIVTENLGRCRGTGASVAGKR